jgi:3-oxoadipate CoA-transferase beta subunit
MAARVARDIPEGAYVNLGIGLPTLVANHLPMDKDIFLHSENGMLGMGPAPTPGAEDPDLTNAGKQPVTLVTGGAFFHHADSFAMIRGRHIDICVLGAFQVSVAGDLAELAHGRSRRDSGRRRRHGSRRRREARLRDDGTRHEKGERKIVETCTYPLTGRRCVSRIYTDLAVLDVTPAGLAVRELVDGLSLEELERCTTLEARS